MGVTLVPLYDHAFDKLTLGALVRADLVIWLARLDPNDGHRMRARRMFGE
jgi:hypothetical protein